ncbi:hypothetical protein [Xylella taiwanensis]|uniref:hypothetical protein n=1 Tax=Xylella taiwanensis TaxID=1444770 RepID=UPI003CCD3779
MLEPCTASLLVVLGGCWTGSRCVLRDHCCFIVNTSPKYYLPKNFNIWYCCGSLLLVVLVNQIVAGIFWVMHDKPSAAEVFQSIEMRIMWDIEWGLVDL